MMASFRDWYLFASAQLLASCPNYCQFTRRQGIDFVVRLSLACRTMPTGNRILASCSTHVISAKRWTISVGGGTNLIIATDVLEEGIDVTACHLVICFDKPPNLKSFIQRRGRARQGQSTFAIMLADDDVSASLNSWQALEEEMIRVYQDDARLLQEVSNLESIQEEVEDEFRVESTR